MYICSLYPLHRQILLRKHTQHASLSYTLHLEEFAALIPIRLFKRALTDNLIQSACVI